MSVHQDDCHPAQAEMSIEIICLYLIPNEKRTIAERRITNLIAP